MSGLLVNNSMQSSWLPDHSQGHRLEVVMLCYLIAFMRLLYRLECYTVFFGFIVSMIGKYSNLTKRSHIFINFIFIISKNLGRDVTVSREEEDGKMADPTRGSERNAGCSEREEVFFFSYIFYQVEEGVNLP